MSISLSKQKISKLLSVLLGVLLYGFSVQMAFAHADRPVLVDDMGVSVFNMNGLLFPTVSNDERAGKGAMPCSSSNDRLCDVLEDDDCCGSMPVYCARNAVGHRLQVVVCLGKMFKLISARWTASLFSW